MRDSILPALFLTAIVFLRSAVFVLWPQSHFDADSAITGLMAKHLAEGRAFPVFYYGQTYMLAVDAWLAAPLFLLFGASVTALKIPLLAVNLAAALLLFRMLTRDAGLRPWLALLPLMFFALPAPGTAARILEANSGNTGPFLYVTLLWALRHRPAWCGLVLGIGFLHREFTLYGLLALLAVETASRDLFTRRRALQWVGILGTAAIVWLVVQGVKPWSSPAGPGSTLADIYQPRDNVSELVSRICVDPAATAGGLGRIVTQHWPALFGTWRVALRDFGIDSALWQGMDWSWVLLSAVLGIALTGVLARLTADRMWRPEYQPCLYLVLIGVFSVAGYLVGRCGEVDFYWMRYDLLSVLGAVGLSAWFLRTAPPPRVRTIWIALLCAWLSLPAVVHGRLWVEYLTRPPVGGKQAIIRELDARGIRVATADYWFAYAITFLTNERIIVASDGFVRVPMYRRIVEAHAGRVVRISREPCAGGEEVVPRVYFCPAGPTIQP